MFPIELLTSSAYSQAYRSTQQFIERLFTYGLFVRWYEEMLFYESKSIINGEGF